MRSIAWALMIRNESRCLRCRRLNDSAIEVRNGWQAGSRCWTKPETQGYLYIRARPPRIPKMCGHGRSNLRPQRFRSALPCNVIIGPDHAGRLAIHRRSEVLRETPEQEGEVQAVPA